MTSLDDLERRLAQLEAREQIRELVWRYSHTLDLRHFDAFFELFTDDCVMDYRPYVAEPFVGKEALRGIFLALPQNHRMTLHLISDPLIEVDGDDATGVWHWLVPSTGYREGRLRPIWQAGYYTMRYRKVAERWLIQRIDVEYEFSSDHDRGWVDDPMNLPDGSGPAS